MAIDVPRILLVDSYDSFTYNLASLLRRSIPGCSIHIIKNDDFNIHRLLPFLRHFSALVVGPGPGSPEVETDIGVVKDLWKLAGDDVLPVFGVCLGLQSLALEFGGRIQRLSVVKHGQISRIDHDGTGLFEGVGLVEAVRYHSLHATLPLTADSDLQPLAWANDEAENGRVLMACTHKGLPFWAVQYHPESVRTNGGGLEVLSNFWRIAQQWSRKQGRIPTPWSADARQAFGFPWPHYSTTPSASRLRFAPSALPIVQTEVLALPLLTVPAVCEILGSYNEDIPFALLDSAAHPGRFSIIGCPTSTSPQITYWVGEESVHITCGQLSTTEPMAGKDIWSWLSAYMLERRAVGGHSEVPFWAGFLGILSYEVGLRQLDVTPKSSRDARRKLPHPDVNLIFVERSIVMDHLTGKVYVQSITPDDGLWLRDMAQMLSQAAAIPESSSSSNHGRSEVTLPDKDRYINGIKTAMEHLFCGDSYELCLTAHTHIRASPQSSWSRYKALRERNAAPHSAYFRLKPTTFLSSSPERFLSYSRSPESLCQLRPIKGTIRRGSGIDRAYAEKALAQNPKEVAENLMIVDLIRHDLHSVVGEDVQVTQFCGVEEYKTVWQLVSVIEGRLGNGSGDSDGLLGWRVLQASLPPGSMTGAPKKRSVEILQDLESSDEACTRVGSGDWAVTIRSCFKHDSTTDEEDWVIGAGGAITALSDPEAEWEEMVVKLGSVLGIFEHGGDTHP
ncbi:para-aminobenzoate synthase [Hymenopellis radicata]|nr:para-aminobenzoate synthase [Hymenopellis radicata]